jgi:hypothetical protein
MGGRCEGESQNRQEEGSAALEKAIEMVIYVYLTSQNMFNKD